MARSDDSNNKDISKQGVPSPPLPKIPSPDLPDAAKKKPQAKKPAAPKPQGTSGFHLENAPEGEKQAAPKSAKPATDQKPAAKAPIKESSRHLHVAPRLSEHGGKPKKDPIPSPKKEKLDKSLQHRPLSIEEKEELENTHDAGFVAMTLETLEPYLLWLLRACVLFGAAALAFLVLNFFKGNLAPGSPLASSHQLLNLIGWANSVLEVTLIGMAICLMLLWFDASAVAFSILILGVVLHFGTPLLLFSEVGRSEATGIITQAMRQTGIVLMFLGMVKYGVDVVDWIRTLPERMQGRADVGVAQKAEAAQRRVAKEANVFSPCWKLPFCREVIRKQCPAYLARKTCWKFGRGCYCDEEMISRIIRGESLKTIKAPTRMSRKGKPPCGRCYIYLEHQSHKFRLLSPLAVPVTVLLVYLLWPTYTKLFTAFSHSLDKFWALLSFNPHNLTSGVLKADSPNDYKNLSSLNPDQVTHVALIIFGVLLGFMLLIYISKFIEWMVYKAKW